MPTLLYRTRTIPVLHAETMSLRDHGPDLMFLANAEQSWDSNPGLTPYLNVDHVVNIIQIQELDSVLASGLLLHNSEERLQTAPVWAGSHEDIEQAI